MKDQYGRNIDYIRISITDRCNLRCKYCMPEGFVPLCHEDILSYEEIIRLGALFSQLGITHMRITGGEPLVRKGAPGLITALKALDGVETVTMTSNGMLLQKYAAELKAAGLDGVNISLDTTDNRLSSELTGKDDILPKVYAGIEAMRCARIPVKLNAVLLRETLDSLKTLTEFAKNGIPVRFIELMPLGFGSTLEGVSSRDVLELLKQYYPDIHPIDANIGSGPAHYYESSALAAPIGFIDAVSNRFCDGCNRVRLTSTGILKPCLCFEEGIDLAALLRSGASDAQIKSQIEYAIWNKPRQHCFEHMESMTEKKLMSQIGG